MRYTVHATNLVNGSHIETMRSFDLLVEATRCALQYIQDWSRWDDHMKSTACVVDNFTGLVIA